MGQNQRKKIRRKKEMTSPKRMKNLKRKTLKTLLDHGSERLKPI